jgi:hypothetical protein
MSFGADSADILPNLQAPENRDENEAQDYGKDKSNQQYSSIF